MPNRRLGKTFPGIFPRESTTRELPANQFPRFQNCAGRRRWRGLIARQNGRIWRETAYRRRIGGKRDCRKGSDFGRKETRRKSVRNRGSRDIATDPIKWSCSAGKTNAAESARRRFGRKKGRIPTVQRNSRHYQRHGGSFIDDAVDEERLNWREKRRKRGNAGIELPRKLPGGARIRGKNKCEGKTPAIFQKLPGKRSSKRGVRKYRGFLHIIPALFSRLLKFPPIGCDWEEPRGLVHGGLNGQTGTQLQEHK